MRFLVGFAAGVAAGYSVCRFVEARAQGVPLALAFRLDVASLLTPVSRLVNPGAPSPKLALPAYAGDAPMSPTVN